MSLTDILRRSANDLLDFFLPAGCQLCTTSLTDAATGLCTDCLARVPQLPAAHCRRCALPYPADAIDTHFCATCLGEKKPPFERVFTAGIYDATLKEAIHRFKYRNKLNLDRPLARLLLKELPPLPDSTLILPVPLHPRRLRARTYNQSALIARCLASRLGCRLDLHLLRRDRDTPAQQGLSADDRRRNLRGAFSLSRPLGGEPVLLVDDVMTTGSTARACCRILNKQGAGPITVAVLARAGGF